MYYTFGPQTVVFVPFVGPQTEGVTDSPIYSGNTPVPV